MKNDPQFSKQMAGTVMQTLDWKFDPQFAPSGVESLLTGDRNSLIDFARREALSKLQASGIAPVDYAFYAVRSSPTQGPEIYGPKNIHVGNYSAEVLYGIAGSPILRFQKAIEALRPRVERAASLNEEDVEYSHQSALLWTEVGELKDFLGASEIITELVAELRTARFQFLGKDTPPSAIQGLLVAVNAILGAVRFDTALVDKVVDALESGGIDPFAPEALRKNA